MREMIIATFTTWSRDKLAKVATDIAAPPARRCNPRRRSLPLYKGFHDLQAPAAEHARLLNTSLDEPPPPSNS
jgi:hypothetical protein